MEFNDKVEELMTGAYGLGKTVATKEMFKRMMVIGAVGFSVFKVKEIVEVNRAIGGDK